MVAPDEEAVSREELAKQQIRVDQVVKKSLAGLKVRGTPTAIVVSKDGRVEKVMAGRLDEKQQQELLAALRGPVQQ
jgi:predicted transcriptional regulator